MILMILSNIFFLAINTQTVMQILEHNQLPIIVKLIKLRSKAMAKDLINDKDFRVYDFTGKKI